MHGNHEMSPLAGRDRYRFTLRHAARNTGGSLPIVLDAHQLPSPKPMCSFRLLCLPESMQRHVDRGERLPMAFLTAVLPRRVSFVRVEQGCPARMERGAGELDVQHTGYYPFRILRVNTEGHKARWATRRTLQDPLGRLLGTAETSAVQQRFGR